MLRKMLIMLDRFNTAHPWSHNDAYALIVVRQARQVARAGGRTAIDIGCGTGNLVRRLAGELAEVVGLEPDAANAHRAIVAASDLTNVRIVQTAFPAEGGIPGKDPEARYDLVSMVAVLHHLELDAGLLAARRIVAPGGRLIIVGCSRETLADLPLSVLSLLLNPLVGAVVHPRRATVVPDHMTAPTTAPMETFKQIKSAAQTRLPGSSIHRGLFWRYVLVWQAPIVA